MKKIINNTKFYSTLFDKLFPLNRSILGKGYKDSLEIINNYMQLKKINFPSGKKVFDWVIPKEWIIKDSYIKELKGKKVLDIKDNSLHLMSYSTPVNEIVNLKELKKKLNSIKSLPNAIPYTFSYYKKNWGFNISENKKKKIKKKRYKVVINSSFKKGNLVIGEKLLKGSSKKYFLISSYLCHPGMANNELSGPLVLLGLFDKIRKIKNRKLNYLFIINPETIGSIAYLHKYKKFFLSNKIIGGLVLTCLGGPLSGLSFKKSKKDDSQINKFFNNIRNYRKINLREYTPLTGSDERQYCSTGFDLPIGQISKTPYLNYKEYHTSLDNKAFMKIKSIPKTVDEISSYIEVFDKISGCIVKKQNCGEIFLSRHDLYKNKHKSEFTKSLIILLAYSDGKTSIMDIANKFKLDLFLLKEIMDILLEKKIAKVIYK